MQVSLRLFALASAMGLALVQAVPVEEVAVAPRDDLEGYEIVPAKWELPINAQGDVREFTGTAQEVHDQILKINPNFDNEVPGANSNPDGDSEELEARELEVRTNWVKTLVNCNDHARTAKHLYADANRVLYRMSGRPTLGAGKCSKVSCSSGASIYWCNNSGKSKTLNGYTSIYQGANRVINICSAKSYSFSGTVFHPTKWAVVLKETVTC